MPWDGLAGLALPNVGVSNNDILCKVEGIVGLTKLSSYELKLWHRAYALSFVQKSHSSLAGNIRI